MAHILQLLLAIFKAIPKVKEMFDDLVAMYLAVKIQELKEENKEMIALAFLERDQRYIENLLGSKRAGKASGYEGTEVVDDLPGVNRPWK